MKTPLLRFTCAGAALFTMVHLSAQVVGKPAASEAEIRAQAMTDAVKFRSQLADAVGAKTVSPDEAIQRLKNAANPTGLPIDASADFAYAAIDVGQRLVSKTKPVEGGSFFLAAEEALDALVKRTPDASARDKAEYLCRLSLVRWKFLNKVAQAKRDIDAAIVLSGKDAYLKQARENLLRSNAEFGKEGLPEVKP